MTNDAETHSLTYRIRNNDRNLPVRTLEVHATSDELAFFAEQGYLIRERLFPPEHVERLRTALAEILDDEIKQMGISRSRRFGGTFLRHLMEKHSAFLELFRFQPTLSVARAMLGPQVQVLPMTARISYPNEPNQETHWHFHQRVIPDPMPPFFARPHVIDSLIYLDDTNDANGPICIVPGTHHRIHEDLPGDCFDDIPGQVTLRLPAGSCVMIHGATWHRALPTRPEGTVRRMLILPYAAAWLNLPSYGIRPRNGLMKALFDNADTETSELLGIPDALY